MLSVQQIPKFLEMKVVLAKPINRYNIIKQKGLNVLNEKTFLLIINLSGL